MSKQTRETDIVIVGAGPAGCILSYLLARSGVDTTLVERRRSLSKEFRGYGFQPPVLRLFDDLDLLEDVLALPHRKLYSGDIIAYDRSFTMFDWREDSDSFDYALQMEQGRLLNLLLDEAIETDSFSYYPGTTVTGLLEENREVVGVSARDRVDNGELTIKSRLVVGADGRYSTVRERAGIPDGQDDTDLELVWFKLSSSPTDLDKHLRIADEGVLVYAPLNESEGQYGVFIEAGTYPDLRENGIKHLQEKVSAIEPSLEDAVKRDLTGFEDCTLLDIEPGIAPEWCRDGLLLIGDAAHIASPFGEGNVLAMHDAVAAHPTIIERLEQESGVLSRDGFREFEAARRETVRDSFASSAHLQGLMSFVTGDSRLPQFARRSVVRTVFRAMYGLRTVTDHVSHGVTEEQYVPVRKELLRPQSSS